MKLRKLNQRNLAGVIQAQTEDTVVVVVTVIHTVVVVVAVEFLGTAVVVAMDTVVATDQLLQHTMAAQHMVHTAEGMDMAVLLLAMAQVMALHMVAPCMEVLMVPTGHMVVPMEVVHMVLQEVMVREDMTAMVGLEAWVVVAAPVVGAPADTTLMENDHPVSLGSDNKSIPSLISATEKMGHSIHLVESAASEQFFSPWSYSLHNKDSSLVAEP